MKLSIYKNNDIPNTLNFSYGQMDYLNRKLEYGVDRFNENISLSNKYVRSDGLLKVIHMLHGVCQLNEGDALYYLDYHVDGVCRILGISTGYSQSKQINGSFYILENNPSLLIGNYMDISALKPKRISRYDLSFSHPSEFGYYGKSIYTIDVILLMMQYRKWYLSRGLLPKSPQIFMYNHVYKNLTKEIFILSLIYYLLDIPGDYNAKNYNTYAIQGPLPIDNLDKLKNFFLKRVSKMRHIRYDMLLDAMPLPLNYNARKFLSDDYIVNNRLYYLYLHSKANVLSALYKLSPDSIKNNKVLARELSVLLRVLMYNSHSIDNLNKDELDTLEKMKG